MTKLTDKTGSSAELHFASGSLVHVNSAVLQVPSGDLVLQHNYSHNSCFMLDASILIRFPLSV